MRGRGGWEEQKEAAGRGLHALRRSPEGGAYGFFPLLWKTRRHGSVTMVRIIIARGKEVKRKR